MSDPRDYKVEIDSLSPEAAAQGEATGFTRSGGMSSRPFLSVMFNCCGVYQRIYRNLDATEYFGR